MTREEAIENVKSAFSVWESEFRVPNDDWSEEHEALDIAIEALKADRPRGEWLCETKNFGGTVVKAWHCSVCGAVHGKPSTTDHYCYFCGAKMDGERSEE